MIWPRCDTQCQLWAKSRFGTNSNCNSYLHDITIICLKWFQCLIWRRNSCSLFVWRSTSHHLCLIHLKIVLTIIFFRGLVWFPDTIKEQQQQKAWIHFDRIFSPPPLWHSDRINKPSIHQFEINEHIKNIPAWRYGQ